MFALVVPDANNNEFPEEVRVEGPDGAMYVVRVAPRGVPRYTVSDGGFFALVGSVMWHLRRAKRWSAEVFTVSALGGVEEPPARSEKYPDREQARVRAQHLVEQIQRGTIGWDRW